jgi:hypothetical protein
MEETDGVKAFLRRSAFFLPEGAIAGQAEVV